MDLQRNISERSIILYFNNCGRSEILLSLQTNTLSYHTCMDAGRRHETPGSETKDIIPLFHTTHGIVHQFSSAPKFQGVEAELGSGGCCTQCVSIAAEGH